MSQKVIKVRTELIFESGEIMKEMRTGRVRRSDLKSKMLRCAENVLPIGLFIFIFLAAFTGLTAGQAIPADQIKPIPIVEVATQAMEASDLLRSLTRRFCPAMISKRFRKTFLL